MNHSFIDTLIHNKMKSAKSPAERIRLLEEALLNGRLKPAKLHAMQEELAELKKQTLKRVR